MKNLINEIIFNLKRAQVIVIIGILVFILGVILGVFVALPEEIFEIHNAKLYEYYSQIFSLDKFGISFLIKRIFNSFLILLLVFLLSLNKYTYYLNFLILFYRGFVLGFAGKLFITKIFVTGAIMFTFLIVIQALFLALAIIIFMSIIYLKNYKIDDCTLKLMLKSLLISFIVAVIGATLEFIFIITLFRPLNLYF